MKLKVVGIYEYKGDTNPYHTTSTDKRNRLIIDHKAMQEIMQRDVIQYDNGVDFYVDDPGEMEKIASQIKALDLDWDSFALTMDNSAYEAVASPLTAMQNLTVWLIVGCVAVSAGILILILSMWIKQRRYETGILLSVGISKSRIILQYTVEVLMIAVVAFGLSFFTSNLISQGVSDLIFHQVSESQPLPEIELPDDGTEYLDITGQYIPYDTSNVETLESVHSVLKKEEIYLHTYQDSKEARRAIFEYIEGWYNRKRIHSSIGYLTPQQKEDENLKKQHNLSIFLSKVLT